MLGGRLEELARVAGVHERVHVEALRRALGTSAVARPRFAFGAAVTDPRVFGRTAIALEEVGVGAYKGQAPLIQDLNVLRAALSIHSVEAKHAAWSRRIAGVSPVRRPVDPPLTREETLQAVAATGFVVG